MRELNIASIPGDGIGKEVVIAGQQVLDTAAEVFGEFHLNYDTFEWSCEYYAKHGKMMPDNALEILKQYDAIFLGAVGFPGIPDHVSLWGLLLPIRRSFQQYINLRPVKLMPGIQTPLAGRSPADIDFLVVRENNEGEYSNMGGRLYERTPQEVVVQNSVFTRYGVERVIRYAFELARKTGRRRISAATKSNGINYTMPFWDEIFEEIASEYSELESDKFGDILTDLGAAIAGSIGIAPSANLNPEGLFPSMFEPVHGSAPDIAGKGVANPMGQIWCGAMMLEHLGFEQAGQQLMEAMTATLSDGILTPDLGGKAKTDQVTKAVCEKIRVLKPDV
jgi:tartrate dehydrogenase/decarboxylase/D-malate dehydrogenase